MKVSCTAFLYLRQKKAANNLFIKLTSAFQLDRDRAIELKKADYKRMMAALNQTLAFDSIFSSLWYSTLPCLDVRDLTAVKSGERSVIKYCNWKGQVIKMLLRF